MQNIMFDAEGTRGVVKVIDFGASQYVQPEETVRVQGLTGQPEETVRVQGSGYDGEAR